MYVTFERTLPGLACPVGRDSGTCYKSRNRARWFTVALEFYRKKRKFDVTSEPRGRKAARGGNRYVIQKHAATRLHYDLRLELDGVMKSWAVTRGPSLDPAEKRLAVHVEDHPIEYNTFEGTIPQGEYGGGTVMIWDRGRWFPEGDPHKGYAKGHLDFTLDGEKLHGRWHLVRMRPRDKDRHENWLLIKAKDEAARSGREPRHFGRRAFVGVTGRSMDEIAEGKGRKRVWHSNRSTATAGPASDPPGPQSQREFKTQLQALAASPRKKNSSSRTGRTAEEKRVPKRPPRRAAKPRSRAKAAVAAAARKRSDPPPRTRRAAARLHPAKSLCHVARHRAERPGLAARDQIRRLPHRGAPRSWQGAAIDAQSTRLDASLRADRAKRSRRCRPRPRCLTANWWSRTTKAFRVSRCCKPI